MIVQSAVNTVGFYEYTKEAGKMHVNILKMHVNFIRFLSGLTYFSWKFGTVCQILITEFQALKNCQKLGEEMVMEIKTFLKVLGEIHF